MLKTSSTKLAKYKKCIVGVGSNSKARCSRSGIDGSGIDDVEVDGVEVEVDEVGKKDQKMSKSKNLSQSKKTVRSNFFTSGARLAFIEFRQTFVKGAILHHFDPKRHIRI